MTILDLAETCSADPFKSDEIGYAMQSSYPAHAKLAAETGGDVLRAYVVCR